MPMRAIKMMIAIGAAVSCLACSEQGSEQVDRLNSVSYSYHYRNLDSTRVYAERALKESAHYADGQAEALNNLAFVSIAKMDYGKALRQLTQVQRVTDNQVELLVSDVQLMRLCQRQSHNKDFYNHRERAMRRLNRINEEYDNLSQRLRKRMIYAESELFIVASVYFYYIGLPDKSVKELQNISLKGEIQQDTAQWLSYLYNVGAGSLVTASTKAEIYQHEFEYLFRCYMAALQNNYPYWEANSMQAISEHLNDGQQRRLLAKNNSAAFTILNTDHMPDSLLAGNLAQRSLELFSKYGDVYQTAGAYRTLASCYWNLADYKSALFCLQNALYKNSAIRKAPDLVASICEQLSLVYSAMNVKSRSDENRNAYLDIQKQTRQDRRQEARAEQLDRYSLQLNSMLAAVAGMIVLVIFLLFVFNYMRNKQNKKFSSDQMLEPLRRWESLNAKHIEELNELFEELHEQQDVARIHVAENKKKNEEQRAKVSLANSVIPFIDRMRHEIHRLDASREAEEVRNERYAYIAELTDKIRDYNDILTHWIQMRQGELNLHIESIALQSLFDIVWKGRMGFNLKGIQLLVEPTEEVVKADRTLTLFMINTLADNARKFTPQGGTVRLCAQALENGYVEISIADNGIGMSEEEVAHLFERKVVNSTSQDVQTSHGFGLMNCKGIIDKYRKISNIFSGCTISVKSEQGKGSCFSFRLPKGVIYGLGALLLLLPMRAVAEQKVENRNKIQEQIQNNTPSGKYLKNADVFANRAYFANINGQYKEALLYADSCIEVLNRIYRMYHPGGKALMVSYSQSVGIPAEIQWLHDGLETNFNIILDIRNESAIAALALHRWALYHYNNEVYTRLFKERSADGTLREYVVRMQQSETNKTVTIIILVILLLMLFPAYYLLFYRHFMMYRAYVERIKDINKIVLNADTSQKKLDSIEHILKSMDKYYRENTQFSSLNAVVYQIRDVLKKSVDLEKHREENIELAEDELHRIENENDQLHVNNSVLDNCLSALKHETMYYPSRIRQLIDDRDEDLHGMTELVDYYKDLYMLLSAQAMRQLEEIRHTCRPLPLLSLLGRFQLKENAKKPLQVMGDEDLLRYLFSLLYGLLAQYAPILDVEVKDQRYIKLSMFFPGTVFTDEECRQLFSPTTGNLQFYVCRQIVRDTGEMTSARGCGAFAYNLQGRTRIELTLPKA